MSDYID